jgi:invasion protein IalB
MQCSGLFEMCIMQGYARAPFQQHMQHMPGHHSSNNGTPHSIKNSWKITCQASAQDKPLSVVHYNEDVVNTA